MGSGYITAARLPVLTRDHQRIWLAFAGVELTTFSLFENTAGPCSSGQRSQMSGNPVRIGDGCATVTGYKLPWPLAVRSAGKAGARFKTRSQDIGLAALVMAVAS